MSLENKIKDLRLARGLTQNALAARADTTAATIQRLETGMRKLTVDWIERIATGLDCDPSEIIRRSQSVPIIGYAEVDGTILWKPPAEAPEDAPAPPGIDPRRAAAIAPSPDRPATYLGGLYYFTRGKDLGVERCINRLSVVQLADNRAFMLAVAPSSQVGKWNLYGLMSPPINYVEIEWAAPIEWVRPIILAD